MDDQFATMIVPANLAPQARDLAAGLSPVGGAAMFITGLSPDGTGTPTHYVSTGYIAPEFLPLTTDADALFGACQQAGLTATHDDCAALVAGCDVSAEEPFAAFARLGLALVQEAA